MSDNGRLNDYIAGAVGGCAGLVVGHPFDTTKVQLQTQAAANRYSGTVDAMKNVYKQGWTKGFFRGMSWPVFSYGVVNSVFFGVYGHALSVLRRLSDRPDDKPRFWEIYTAGCVGGAAAVVVCCPVDLVKVVLQSQIPHGDKVGGNHGVTYRGPWSCAVDIVRRNGVTGLYRGVLTMAYRDLPSFGIYTTTYQLMFDTLKDRSWTDSHGVLASLLAGGMAGVGTWLPVIPFDVAKSRLQADMTGTKYKGLVDCLVKSYLSEGLVSLFRGGLLICVRAFIVNSVTFLFYSQTLKYMVTEP